MPKRVFVSSTFADLRDYRASVRDAIQRLGAIDIAMEKFGSAEDRPKDLCVRLIREEADLFVGIYAHRYGFVPPGDAVSLCETEYEAAGMAGCHRFVYLVDDNVAWLPAHIEDEPGRTRLRKMKERLRLAHTCTAFATKEQLAACVTADLAAHLQDSRGQFTSGHRGLFHQPPSTWSSPVAGNRQSYKVVAFDLDGTLLRGDGFQFSWEAVWNGLGFAHPIQQKLKSAYRKRAHAAATPELRNEAYRDWCRGACDHFRQRKLDRAQIRQFGEALRLTKNFAPTMKALRDAGIVTAVISGGIHPFLEDKIPDYRSLFDFVFINELKFDDKGMLSDVIATDFDFAGKADALRLICERVGCALEETVFVGDGFNDEDILLAAGKAIAYPPSDQAVKGAAMVHLPDDDLSQIIPHILA